MSFKYRRALAGFLAALLMVTGCVSVVGAAEGAAEQEDGMTVSVDAVDDEAAVDGEAAAIDEAVAGTASEDAVSGDNGSGTVSEDTAAESVSGDDAEQAEIFEAGTDTVDTGDPVIRFAHEGDGSGEIVKELDSKKTDLKWGEEDKLVLHDSPKYTIKAQNGYFISMVVQEQTTFTDDATEEEKKNAKKLIGVSDKKKAEVSFADLEFSYVVTVYFIKESDDVITVDFQPFEAFETFYPLYVNRGDVIGVSPGDPTPKEPEYTFEGWYGDEEYNKKWDFEKDKVEPEEGKNTFTIYAHYNYGTAPGPYHILSSTWMHGTNVDTVIGQGCKVKLFIADTNGNKKKVKKGEVKWEIKPTKADGTSPSDHIILKEGKNATLICKKTATPGYKATVTAVYQNYTTTYKVTVIKKIEKFGFKSGGKIVSSRKHAVTNGYADFGYGPTDLLADASSFNYVSYYTKSDEFIGTALYNYPANWSNVWIRRGVKPTVPKIFCAAKLPKQPAVTGRKSKSYGASEVGREWVACVPLTKGKYKVVFIAPDGSGKKFTVTYEAGKSSSTKKKK